MSNILHIFVLVIEKEIKVVADEQIVIPLVPAT